MVEGLIKLRKKEKTDMDRQQDAGCEGGVGRVGVVE